MSYVAETATLVYGYTMGEIDRIARAAIRRHSALYRTFVDSRDRDNIAWDAVVERLYTWPYTATPPVFFDLYTAAWDALNRASNAQNHHYGIPITGAQAPNFTKFWISARRNEGPSDFTERLCETIALPSALAVLSVDEYDAIVTLAAFNGANAAAAQALGWKYGTFTTRTDAARKAIREVWFEGETPVQRTREDKDVECKYGHSRAEHSYRERNGQWRCRKCHKLSGRRARAREDRVEIDLTPDPPAVLTFAPAPDEDPDVLRTAFNTCHCGLPFGHDWPHKDEGAPHPATAA